MKLQKKKADSDDDGSDADLIDGSGDEFDAMIKSTTLPREKTGRRAASKVVSFTFFV